MREERREHPRIYCKLPGEYRGRNIWQEVTIYNLGKGGMFIAAQEVEPPGTPVEIYFDFGQESNKRFLRINALVIWNREKEEEKERRVFPPGMGVKFQKIFPVDGEEFLGKAVKAMLEDKSEKSKENG